MYPYHRKVTILLCAAGLWSCNSAGPKATAHTGKLQEMQWLLGHWEQQLPQALLCETWERDSDSLYKGKSYIVKGNDTTMLETIRLEQLKDGLYYIPTTSGQNDGNPVPFKLTQSSARQLIFENPEHDFPKKITYTLVTTDSILAEISGPVKGKERTQQFPMHRVKR